MDSKVFKSHNSLWKNLMLQHQLNLILHYNQGLALLDENRSLDLLVTNICKNRTMKISLFHYSMLSYILPTTIFLLPREEILHQTHIFKSTVQTDNLSAVAFHPGIFQKNLLLFIRDLCRCLQPCLISFMTFGEKLLPTIKNI